MYFRLHFSISADAKFEPSQMQRIYEASLEKDNGG